MALALDGTPQTLVSAAGLTAVNFPAISTTYGYGKCVVYVINNSSSAVSGLSSVTSTSSLVFSSHITFLFPGAVDASCDVYTANITATPLSAETVTLNFTNTSTYTVGWVFVVSNAGNSAGLGFDSGGPQNIGTANGLAGVTQVSMTTVTANAFVCGFCRQMSTAQPTGGTGWTAVTAAPAGAFSLAEYQVASSTGTFTVSDSATGDMNWNGITAIIANGGAAPVASATPRLMMGVGM